MAKSKSQFFSLILSVISLVGLGLGPEAAMARSHMKRASKPMVAELWLTRADQSKLLSHEPSVTLERVDIEAAASGQGLMIEPEKRYQTMVGFGAAMTDASAYGLRHNLGSKASHAMMKELFDPNSGLGLSFIRLTIGASDFSTHPYSYDDQPLGQTDEGLSAFSMAPVKADIVPLMREAKRLNKNLFIMASPWSAPGWMKTSDRLIEGRLRPEAYGAFARYLSRYILEMKAEGLEIKALTLQNEPHFEPKDYPGMRVDPASRAAFIGGFLGPEFQKNHIKTRILDWDHNWDEPQSPSTVLKDPKAAPFIAGVAWHCYGGDVKAQTEVALAFPQKETYFTECSGGTWAPQWDESFLWFMKTLIIGSTKGYAKGVALWNLALDENNGPHSGGCGTCRGVITINSKTGAITRNLEYYVLGHASRFVKPGAVRIGLRGQMKDIDGVAFENPDGRRVVILVNEAKTDQRVELRLHQQRLSYSLSGRSALTVVWPQKTGN